jgi:hypothetical protein
MPRETSEGLVLGLTLAVLNRAATENRAGATGDTGQYVIPDGYGPDKVKTHAARVHDLV